MGDGVLIPLGHQKVMDGIVSFEVHLYSHFVAYISNTFTETLSIGYQLEDVVVVGVAVVGLLSIPQTMGLLGTELKADFELYPI